MTYKGNVSTTLDTTGENSHQAIQPNLRFGGYVSPCGIRDRIAGPEERVSSYSERGVATYLGHVREMDI